MTTSFLHLYNNPPSGRIKDGSIRTGRLSLFQHPLPAGLPIPDEIVDSLDLPVRLAQWGRAYLGRDHIPQPAQNFEYLAEFISQEFDNVTTGSERAALSIYAGTIRVWSAHFVAMVDNIPRHSLQFLGTNHTGYKWERDGEARMIVQFQGNGVFNTYCGVIRDLATANNGRGSYLTVDNSGHVEEAQSILLNLSRQMLEEQCQIGILFGGSRFILFAIEELHREDVVVRQMQCSDILQVSSRDDNATSPNAIQLTIAALLGPKDVFFRANNMAVGLTPGNGESNPKKRKTADTDSPDTQLGEENDIGFAESMLAGISRLSICYSSYPDTKYSFMGVDTPEPVSDELAQFHKHVPTAELVLYETIGESFSRSVFAATLQRGEQSIEVAAKFYDPITEDFEEGTEDSEGREDASSGEEEDGEDNTERPEPNTKHSSSSSLPNADEEYAFRCEIEAYKRLGYATICPRYYGAFQGLGFTGFQTGVILMEKLPVLFSEFSDMTREERQVAYGHVLELHKLGIHHGGIKAPNFGAREEHPNPRAGSQSKRKRQKRVNDDKDMHSAVVIFDFSHSSTFADCNPETCWELTWARQMIIEGRVPDT